MTKIMSPVPVDLTLYAKDAPLTETMYGLPLEVKFCSRCVISNQRPNSTLEYKHKKDSKKETVHFDNEEICDACRVAEKKHQTINWQQREEALQALCDKHRKNNGQYDCLLPGSGGKDSFYASHILKYKYNMHPLTITWAPHIYTEWGWRNFQNWIHAGFDNQLFTPNGRVHRLLTRLALEKIFHPFQPFFLGQKSFIPKMALEHDIPLVFYGENEAEYGNPIVDSESARRNFAYFAADDKSQVMLSGTSIKELQEDFGLDPNDLDVYMPPSPDELVDKGVDVHYLGYYLKWHPQSCYYYAVEHGGFEASPERNPGTYSKYASIDDKIDDFHFYTTFLKFGIGHATHDAAQEVRSGDITREEAVALVHRFDGEFPERFAEEIFRYLSINEKEFPVASAMFEEPRMTREYFEALANTFRSPHLWVYDNDRWCLRHIVSQ